MTTKAKGKWITIEGTEGVGKSTQIKAIGQLLTDKDVPFIKTREPGGTHTAEALRTLLLEAKEPLYPKTELLLLYAARLQHVGRVIEPALEQGRWVICDRYNDSSYAYQGAGRQLSAQTVDILDNWTMEGFPAPDKTIILDAPVSVGLGRIADRQHDRIESEKEAFFERVREGFLERAAKNPERYQVIDATQPEAQVTETLIETLLPWLN